MWDVTSRARTFLTAAAATALALGTAACSTGSSEPDAALDVLASFYPLQFVAEQVGGPAVSVANLTPPGGEPHNLELSPATLRTVAKADVVIYQSGFQAAVDQAVADGSPKATLDAARFADLDAHEEHESEEHDDHEDESHDGHDHSGLDPHFWLDPTLLAGLATEVGETFAAADPDDAAGYRERAAALVATLAELDDAFTTGLASCDSRTFVTTHEAFGYLAHRYSLEQIGISGLDPETEPSPARLREVSTVIEEAGVRTVFSESATTAKVAKVLADDLGIETAVLDPLESRTDAQLAADDDYLVAMTANLAALKEALGCA